MGNKKLVAMSMVLLLALHNLLASVSVDATEIDVQLTDVKEYVVQVDDNKEFKEVVENNQKAVVKDDNVVELKEENIVVLELTDEEVEELEEVKNIVVEENVLFTASTTDGDGVVAENTTKELETESDTNNKREKSKKEENTKSKRTQNNNLSQKDSKKKIDKKSLKQENADELQWNLSAIHLTEEATGNDTIKVALLDSGVSYDEDIVIADRIVISDGLETENVLFDGGCSRKHKGWNS